MLKRAGDELVKVVVKLLNELLAGTAAAPRSRYVTRFRVLFKKGEQTSMDNYRPIAIIPIC